MLVWGTISEAFVLFIYPVCVLTMLRKSKVTNDTDEKILQDDLDKLFK